MWHRYHIIIFYFPVLSFQSCLLGGLQVAFSKY